MLELAPDKIAQLGLFPITNTYLTSLIVIAIIGITAYIFSRNVKVIPGKFQNFIEFIIEFMFNTAKEIVGDEAKTRDFFPLIATFFIYIIVSNWFGLFPFVGTIGFFKSFSGQAAFTPLLRTVNSDLNATAVLAVVSMVATQYYGIKYNGIKVHLKRYFSFNPIYLFVGMLEIVSEFTKIVSLSFRLFGNILSGDIVIATFTSFAGFFVPLPFMGLEMIVGFVQAAVFAMLSLAFTNILSEHPVH